MDCPCLVDVNDDAYTQKALTIVILGYRAVLRIVCGKSMIMTKFILSVSSRNLHHHIQQCKVLALPGIMRVGMEC
eukprot:1160997-Pelagomonas_calceolata.AAC.8